MPPFIQKVLSNPFTFAATGPLTGALANRLNAAGAAYTTASKQNAVTTKEREASGGSTLPSGPSGGAQLPPPQLPPQYTGGYVPTMYVPGPTTYLPSPSYPTSPYTSAVSTGDVIKALSPGCDYLPSPLKEICQGVGTVFGSPKPTTTASTGNGTAVQPATCPPGTVKVGNTCVSPGDMFPGGDPGMFEAGGQAVVGAFGLPALSPTIVGSVAGRNGVSAIRRCPRGTVLGFDNFCYPKAVLPRRSRFRKHKGDRRPPMTGADAAALRRIGTLQKRVKELAKDAGISCSTRRRK